MIELNKIYNEDCLEGMKRIPDGSVDCVICDLPYGTTKNYWDSVIPLDNLWVEYRRIVKPSGAIVLFSQMPFTAILASSNLEMFKYEIIWEKDNATYYATVKGIVSSFVDGSITVDLYTNGSEGAPALNDTAFTLKPTIAKWYYALRTLAIVVMLLILVSIGIRIMTSSIASEKSKYKNMLVDWVVAFCLIFIMHYIMVFANNINDSLIKIFDSVAESRGFTAVIDDEDGSLWKKLNEKDGIQLDPNMRINDP